MREDRITCTLCYPREEEKNREKESKKEELSVLSHILGYEAGRGEVRCQAFGQESGVALGHATISSGVGIQLLAVRRSGSGGRCDEVWRTQRTVPVDENVRLETEDTFYKRMRNE